MISPELASKISDIQRIFLESFAVVVMAMPRDGRTEYLKMIVRELKFGKFRLYLKMWEMGDILAIRKYNDSQYKIWDNSIFSRVAVAPAKPRRLANPSSFLDM